MHDSRNAPNRVAREVALPRSPPTEQAGPHAAVQTGEGREILLPRLAPQRCPVWWTHRQRDVVAIRERLGSSAPARKRKTGTKKKAPRAVARSASESLRLIYRVG